MYLTDFDELPVIDARGRDAGKVARALFHPSEPVLVGFEVRMKPLGYVLERPRRYAARSGAAVSKKKVALAKGSRLERITSTRSGIDWEETVIWHGMPVRTTSGTLLGEVKEAELDDEGRVTRVVLTRGATSDIAIGVREVPGEFVLGFSDGAVRVDDVIATPEFSGGLAAGAGRSAAVAKVGAERAARGAVSAAIVAARAAKRSGVGKHAAASWKGFAKGVKDGMKDETGTDER